MCKLQVLNTESDTHLSCTAYLWQVHTCGRNIHKFAESKSGWTVWTQDKILCDDVWKQFLRETRQKFCKPPTNAGATLAIGPNARSTGKGTLTMQPGCTENQCEKLVCRSSDLCGTARQWRSLCGAIFQSSSDVFGRALQGTAYVTVMFIWFLGGSHSFEQLSILDFFPIFFTCFFTPPHPKIYLIFQFFSVQFWTFCAILSTFPFLFIFFSPQENTDKVFQIMHLSWFYTSCGCSKAAQNATRHSRFFSVSVPIRTAKNTPLQSNFLKKEIKTESGSIHSERCNYSHNSSSRCRINTQSQNFLV